MYESDGSIMVYWHALDTPETPTGKLPTHASTQILTCLNDLPENNTIRLMHIFLKVYLWNDTRVWERSINPEI